MDIITVFGTVVVGSNPAGCTSVVFRFCLYNTRDLAGMV